MRFAIMANFYSYLYYILNIQLQKTNCKTVCCVTVEGASHVSLDCTARPCACQPHRFHLGRVCMMQTELPEDKLLRTSEA